jgi:hypothetical protein
LGNGLRWIVIVKVTAAGPWRNFTELPFNQLARMPIDHLFTGAHTLTTAAWLSMTKSLLGAGWLNLQRL